MSIDTGSLGIWRRSGVTSVELAAEVESLGYSTLWIGGSPDGGLAEAEQLLAATRRLVVATGIVNIWKDDAPTVADSYHRIAASHPDRLLLGIGAGHREATGAAYVRPYEALVRYLDDLDARGVPVANRALAALGPRVLALAGSRTAGAHPYLTTPEHTRWARQELGDAALLAPEHKVVLDTDEGRARNLGRRALRPYLGLENYANSLRRLGFSEADLRDGGSDRLVDALVLHGELDTVVDGLRAHHAAGADHVTVQVLTEAEGQDLPAYRQLAERLLTRP